MEDLIKKVSYLKGYADGLDLSPKSDEGKLIIKLLDVMSEMADTIEELNSRVDDVEDVVDELDDCVLEIADDLYGDDEYDDYDDDDDDDYIDDYDDDDYDSDGNDYFEIQCPNCGEDVMIDFDMIDDDNAIVCPNCHEEIELEFDCDCDDDGAFVAEKKNLKLKFRGSENQRIINVKKSLEDKTVTELTEREYDEY